MEEYSQVMMKRNWDNLPPTLRPLFNALREERGEMEARNIFSLCTIVFNAWQGQQFAPAPEPHGLLLEHSGDLAINVLRRMGVEAEIVKEFGQLCILLNERKALND